MKNTPPNEKGHKKKASQKVTPPKEEALPFIAFRGVSKRYGSFYALKDINLSIEKGEFVSFVGPSGAGKSTLLNLLYAKEFPEKGEVLFRGRPTTAVKKRLLPYYRRNFGMVFQDYKLLPERTAFENVAFALEVDGCDKDTIVQEVNAVLRLVGLETKRDLFPSQLSGGEAQRVSLARALVHRPHVIIADEPTGNLDPEASQNIIDLLLKINEFGTTVLLATHDERNVNRIGRRLVALQQGTIVRDQEQGKYVLA